MSVTIEDIAQQLDLSVSTVFQQIFPSPVMTAPALTTARQPIPEMGRLAMECLLAHIADRELPSSQHILPIELVMRDSTGPKKM